MTMLYDYIGLQSLPEIEMLELQLTETNIRKWKLERKNNIPNRMHT